MAIKMQDGIRGLNSDGHEERQQKPFNHSLHLFGGELLILREFELLIVVVLVDVD